MFSPSLKVNRATTVANLFYSIKVNTILCTIRLGCVELAWVILFLAL